MPKTYMEVARQVPTDLKGRQLNYWKGGQSLVTKSGISPSSVATGTANIYRVDVTITRDNSLSTGGDSLVASSVVRSVKQNERGRHWVDGIVTMHYADYLVDCKGCDVGVYSDGWACDNHGGALVLSRERRTGCWTVVA